MARPSQPVLFLCLVALAWIGARVIGRIMTAEEPVRDDKLSVTAKRILPRNPPAIGANRNPQEAVLINADQFRAAALGWRAPMRVVFRPVELPWRRAIAAATAISETEPGFPAVAAHTTEATPRQQPAVAVQSAPIAETAGLTVAPTAPTGPASTDRWAASAWLFGRSMAGQVPLGQGLLGGSQAGVRGAWRIDRAGRVELYARLVSSGRPGDGAEGAVGVSARLLDNVPVRVSLERREQLTGSGGRSALALFASGGVDDIRLPLQARLSGYAAAGVVGARRRDLFAESAVTVRRPLAQIGPVAVDASAGAWAAAQPGLERVDAGPGLSARWRIGAVEPRLSVDWRQRVAGDAAPQSGVAVTLAADF